MRKAKSDPAPPDPTPGTKVDARQSDEAASSGERARDKADMHADGPQLDPDHVTRATSTPLIASALHYVRDDPTRVLSLGYAWLTAVGFARLFGNGAEFGINAIEIASPSDFLVAGLRDPLAIVLAAMTGFGLFRLWSTFERKRNVGPLLTVAALLVLCLAASLSAAYRRAVITGPWRDASFAPLLARVTIGDSPTLEDLRIVFTTADFIVFYADGRKATVVVARDEVKRVELPNK